MARAPGFRIHARGVAVANNGLLVLGDQRATAMPLGTQGVLHCVHPLFFHLKLVARAGICDGQYAFMLQDLIDQAPIVSPGVTLHVQPWSRDQGSADGFLLSDGLTFDVCP